METSLEERPLEYASRTQWRGQFRFAETRHRSGLPGDADRHVSRVEGRVYLDRNANGVFDDGDRPLSDAEVILNHGMRRVRTDGSGQYQFAAVKAGKHVVEVVPETVRADLSLMDKIERPLVVPAYQTARSDWRACVNRRATGVLYRDANGNGQRDEGEPGIAEARVMVPGRGDTITDRHGRWRVSDLPPGVYQVLVDETSLDAGDLAPRAVEVAVIPDLDPDLVEIGVRVKQRAVTRKVFGDGAASRKK